MPEVVYVSFSAEIIPATTESLIGIMANLVKQNVKEVNLLLSTPGGSVMHGFNLYNFLKGLPFKLITHNVGNVDSIGNVIFLAGKNRFACANSTFMFHGVGFDHPGGMRLEEKLLRERLDGILSDQKRMGSVIKERTTLADADIENLFREAKTKTAKEAMGFGIIEEIREVQIPSGAEVIPLIFKR